jgi:predicted dehydrogenase
MEEMSDIIFKNKKPVVPIDGEEALKDLKIIDAIYETIRTGKKIDLKA